MILPVSLLLCQPSCVRHDLAYETMQGQSYQRDDSICAHDILIRLEPSKHIALQSKTKLHHPCKYTSTSQRTSRCQSSRRCRLLSCYYYIRARKSLWTSSMTGAALQCRHEVRSMEQCRDLWALDTDFTGALHGD
jgi:hypothetical protein